MKQIVAIVKPFLAERVLRACGDFPIEELIAREVKGFGRQKNYLENYRSDEYVHAFVAKVEITIWLDDQFVDEAVAKLKNVSRTGRLGDGKIMVLPLHQA